jgi:hypothetical protein
LHEQVGRHPVERFGKVEPMTWHFVALPEREIFVQDLALAATAAGEGRNLLLT